MNKSNSLLTLATMIAATLAFSCGPRKFRVSFDGDFAKENKVIVDEIDLATIDTSQSYPKLRLTQGPHQLQINDATFEFTVTGTGHLNVTGEDMGIYPIEYVLGEPDSTVRYAMPSPFIYDSTLYYDPAFGGMTPGIALELAKTEKRNTYPYEGAAEIVKIPKDVLFIEKNWDFGIGEDAPEDLTTILDPDVKQKMVFKTALGDGYLVRFYAMLSLGYDAVNIGDIGKGEGQIAD